MNGMILIIILLSIKFVNRLNKKMHFSINCHNLKQQQKNHPPKGLANKNHKPLKQFNYLEKQNYHSSQYLGHVPKKQMKISHNIVNVTLNEVNLNHSQLLDSLLFSNEKHDPKDNSISSDDDELLLSDYHQIECHQLNIEPILQPIVQRSPTNQYQFLITCPRLPKPCEDQGILWKRLKYAFNHNSSLIDFFLLISSSLNELALQNKVRKFLFENSIIFNKQQLLQFMAKWDLKEYDANEIGSEIERMFMWSEQITQDKLLIGDYRIRSQVGEGKVRVWEMIQRLKNEERELKFMREWASAKLLK